jgi:hypothetical protein
VTHEEVFHEWREYGKKQGQVAAGFVRRKFSTSSSANLFPPLRHDPVADHHPLSAVIFPLQALI